MAVTIDYLPVRRSRPNLYQRMRYGPARMRGWIRLLGVVVAMAVIFAVGTDFSALQSPLP